MITSSIRSYITLRLVTYGIELTVAECRSVVIVQSDFVVFVKKIFPEFSSFLSSSKIQSGFAPSPSF